MEDRKKYDGLNTTLIQTLRKKIEELRESEEKFETIFESIPDGVLLADVSTMKFSFGNKAILCMLGYTADEIKKLSVNDIHPKKDLPYVRQVFEKQARKEMGIAPGLPVKRKDGSVFYADINSFPLVLNGKRYLAGVFRDMTEIKKAGEALKDAEEKWTSLTSNANDVIMIVDGKGIIYYINKTYPPYTPEETVGNSVYKYSLKEQHKIMKDSLKRVFKTGKPASYEISSDIPKTGIVAFSTKVVPIIINKKVVKAILLSTDITEQKKAEEALKRSEWGYKELAESISDVFFAVNKELRCTYWNKTSEKLTGISAKDALGKYIFDIVPAVAANRKAEVEEIFLKAMRTKQPQQVVNEAQLGGKDFFFEIKLYPSQDGASVFIKDITERKKAEEALKESNAFTESTLNSITDMFYAFDLKGKFLSWNKAFSRISGYSDQELSSKKPTDFFSGENIQRIAEAVKRIYTEGTSRIDANFVLKDGRQIPCEFTGSVLKDGKGHIIGFSGTGRDITERKKAEEAIKESEAKYKAIVENATDWIFLLDTKLRFISLNQAIANLFHKLPNEMIGKSILDMFPKETAAGFARNNYEVIRTGKSKFIEEKMVVHGREFYISTRLNPVKNSEGKVVAVMGITRNITEQKKAEEALRDAEEKWTSLTSNANDVIMIVDGKGIIYYINKTYPPYTPEETVGNSMYKYTLKEQHKIMRDSLKRVFKTGKPASYEISSDIPKIGIVAFSTKVVPIIINKKVVKAILLSTDITERKKVEEALKESNAFTESTLNSITDMFYAFDLKGKFLSWNKAFSRISGYSDQELSSKKPTDFFSGEDIQRIAEAVKRIYTEGTSRIDANFVLKDGRQIPCEFTGSVLKDGKGHIIGFSGTGRDITERKKAEEALKESEEKFSSIVNSTQDGIMVTNLVNSRIRFANSAVAKMLGYKSSKAMIGKKAMKLYSNPEERKKIVDTLRKTGHVKVDLKLKKKSGGFVGILGSCTVQKDKKTGELQIQSIFKDVTEQEKVEDRLRTIEREFEKELHRLKKEARGKQ